MLRRMPVGYRVYVLQNRERKFYIGLSDDVVRRVAQHNFGWSKWTKGKGPWKLVWQSDELSLSEARTLENRLKRQGRGRGFYSMTGLQREDS
jgi:putative endonuclease